MEENDVWATFIEFCKANPYCTFEQLEIKGGVPVIGTLGVKVTPVTRVVIKKNFTRMV